MGITDKLTDRPMEIKLKHSKNGIEVITPNADGVTVGKVVGQCVICRDTLYNPYNLLLLHKAEGIQIHFICGKTECWAKVGRKMVKGLR